jgi:hypothetical protein
MLTPVAPNHLGFNGAFEWLAVYSKIFGATLQGDKAVFAARFQDGRDHDNEQELELLQAVGAALRTPGYTPESVGLAVIRCVSRIANEYASWKADEAAKQVRESAEDTADEDFDRDAA